MNTDSLTLPAPRDRGPLGTLFRAYWGRILITYGLFNLENLVHLAQPLVLGLAISDLLASSYRGVLLFVLQHCAFMSISVARRVYDSRAFRTIYTALATDLVLEQRRQEVEISRVAARSALARELVNFFERDIPIVVQAAYSVVGAAVMLCFYDRMIALLCLLLVGPVCLLSRSYGRKTLALNRRLNDELEREVEVIGGACAEAIHGHYSNVAHWRNRLTDREAINFSIMEVFVLAMMAAALLRSCSAGVADMGQIVAVFRYVLMFIMGLDSVPMLVQQMSRLHDIGRRLRVVPASTNLE
jgi:ABC-type multidrug transport system fused ATPase/permease subunit